MAKALLNLIALLWLFPASASIFDGELSTPSTIHHMLTEDKFLIVEVGLVYLRPDLKSFDNILVENLQTSTQTRYGSVASDYPDQFAQTLILQTYLNKNKHWTAGIKTILPLNALAQLDTGSMYVPEYVLYRSNFQRPQLFVFSGFDLNERMRLGAGIEIGFNATTDAHLFLHAGNGKYSDQRLSIRMKPTYTPWIGMEGEHWNFSIRSENKTKLDMNVIAAARIFSNIDAGIPFSYNSNSSLYFVPWTFELQGKIPLNEALLLRPSLSYQLWSRFEPPAAIIADQSQIDCQGQGTCGNSTFSASRTADYQARDILVPAMGAELKMGQETLLWGYRFKPSIFKSTPDGFGNYLDPARHDLMTGFRTLMDNGWEWGMNFQLSRLVTQTVVKSNSGDIGAPGYEAGGWLYGGGIQLAVPF